MKKIHISLVLLLSIFHFSCKNEKLDSSIIKIKASKVEYQNKLLVDSTEIEKSEWISDFKQKNIIVNKAYNNGKSSIFRWK